MNKWQCHKIVDADQIKTYRENPNGLSVSFLLVTGEKISNVPISIFARGNPEQGDYLVRYEDGYLSCSPKDAFENGYTKLEL